MGQVLHALQCYRERAIAEEPDVATAGARSDAADAVDKYRSGEDRLPETVGFSECD